MVGSVLSKEITGPSGVTCAKPCVTTPRLTPNLVMISASPSNGIFHQSLWIYLVSTTEVRCSTDPCSPLREGDLATNHQLFVHITSLSQPLLPGSLSFRTAVWSSFPFARWEAAQLRNCWIKPIGSLKFSYLSFVLTVSRTCMTLVPGVRPSGFCRAPSVE